jgi:kelch-like protein 20
VLNGKKREKEFVQILLFLFRFDPQTNQWSNEIASTNSCRTNIGVADLDGCLFAVGGEDEISCLNLVEK